MANKKCNSVLPKVCMSRKDLNSLNRRVLESFLRLDGFVRNQFTISFDVLQNGSHKRFNSLNSLILYMKSRSDVEIRVFNYTAVLHSGEIYNVYIKFGNEGINYIGVSGADKNWESDTFIVIEQLLKAQGIFDWVKCLRSLVFGFAILSVFLITFPIAPAEIAISLFSLSLILSILPENKFPLKFLKRNKFLLD